MNARLYDAKLHCFLAHDNFIQDPNQSQGFNRYGYVLNNVYRFKRGDFWRCYSKVNSKKTGLGKVGFCISFPLFLINIFKLEIQLFFITKAI